jgi:hypothetical protein
LTPSLKGKDGNMKEEVEAVVEPFALEGNRGTPILYEDIVPWRDVVFLRWDQPYDEEDQSRGAPVRGTFCYTGYLREKRGRDFVFTYFSNIVADGHLPAMKVRESYSMVVRTGIA